MHAAGTTVAACAFVALHEQVRDPSLIVNIQLIVKTLTYFATQHYIKGEENFEGATAVASGSENCKSCSAVLQCSEVHALKSN